VKIKHEKGIEYEINAFFVHLPTQSLAGEYL
jgi:hypothetical protein